MAAPNDGHVDPAQLRAQARSQRKSLSRLSVLIRQSVRLVWASGRGLFLGLLALQIAAALALAGQVLAVQAVLAAVLDLEAGSQASAALWVPVLLLAVLTAVTSIISAVQGHMQRLLGERVARSMWDQVLEVSTGVGLASFESPDFFNRLQRVQSNALSRPYQVTQGLIAMGGALAAGIGVGAALVSISPLLLPLLIIGGVPVLLSSRRESRLEFDFAMTQTPVLRMRQYLTLVQTGREEAKEVRAFGLAAWLHARFALVYDTYLGDLSRHLRRRATLSVLGNLGSAVVLVLTLAALVWMILTGQVTVAGAGAAIVAIRMLATQIQTLFAGVQRIFESGLFLEDLRGFLALAEPAREDVRGPDAPAGFAAVGADRVSFTYPGSEQPAVREATVDLRAGEVVAVVGENGSGKTTLAKMLAGLYEPSTGAIRWDGTDIRQWSLASVRSKIAVIFQDFVRYALSAEDNIATGDVSQPPTSDRVRRAARAAGAAEAIESMPDGYATPLSRLFAGGRDLSGGQWQRVAIARGYYRDAQLVILDEPSAALDPRAEHELFASLRHTLEGRTALFISHRFSTVRAADRIYVMDAGSVVEHGTHEELMAAEGQYADLFRVQAAAYLPPEQAGETV
ncbi:ABC transporter ATP-binding protein [Ruania zhangjianzhongii]|uniref:ABC transporter ATP-binding protein n=1 Tax=Ruania zhangjianzhongii TaxID=2603206 RepID=UPI0011CA466A|nr:ABC transporter ATP-binding protein [Ruania zhangjianzhongii]